MPMALPSRVLERAGFRNAFFTREGGVSSGAYATLNFAWSTGDLEENVRENLRRAGAFLDVGPEKLFFLSQVHGTTVRRVDRGAAWDDVIHLEGDAVVSSDPLVACSVRAADCVPILVGDARSGAAVAIHSGWRGTVSDVCAAGVRALRDLAGDDGDLVAAVGPHISRDAFEVGEEVAREIEAASPVPDVIDRVRFEKPRADLRRIVEAQLRRAGVREIDHVEGCTFSDASRFFSFRRDGAKSGRHLACIVPRTKGLERRPAMADDRPLLALVMIVKNEARAIRKTIDSVKPFVDRWLILDTGSTDGTPDLVRQAFDGVPGRLVEEPFVDFGTTRSRALELLGTETVFSLMLSGDETLVNGEALRKFCEEHKTSASPAHGAYYVRIHFGTSVYDSARLARTDHGWRYVGATHEVLLKEKTPPPTIRVPDAHIEHDVAHRDAAGQKRRWELDLKLLEAEQKKRPNDTRTQFYLAQTLECLGEHRKAFGAYEKRVKMGGWQEEVYEALFRMGRCAQAGGAPWQDVQQRYLDAYAHSPHRAEPLFAVAWHWYEKKNWPLTYLFAKRGSEIPFPEKATLFVDADVYKTKLHDLVGTAAYYVGEIEAGEAALRKLLELSPNDARLQKNLAFYEEKRKKAQKPAKSEKPRREAEKPSPPPPGATTNESITEATPAMTPDVHETKPAEEDAQAPKAG